MNQVNSRLLAFGAMLVLLALYFATQYGYFGANPVGQSGQDNNPLIIPAGYAFAIWGPIYLSIIVFPIYQLIKKRDGDDRWIPIRQWYALNVVANGLWLVAASYDWVWVTVGIIVVMLYSLFRIRQLLWEMESSDSPMNYWAEQLVFSLYFAWVTLATALNVASALYFYDWNGFGIDPMIWSVAILLVAAGITGFVANRYRDAAYAGVVVWAFCAIVLRHWGSLPTLAYLSLGVAVLFSVLAVTLLLRRLKVS